MLYFRPFLSRTILSRMFLSRSICALMIVACLLTPATARAQLVGDCTVVTDNLNLREGPGGNYTSLTKLASGTELVAYGHYPGSTWISVQVKDTDTYGWVNGSSRYVSCDVEIASLPETQSTAQPSGEAYVVRFVPTPNANAGDMIGTVYASGDYFYQAPEWDADSQEYYGNEELTFNGKFSIGLNVYDPRAGTSEGAGVDRVEFDLENEETFDEIYTMETDDGDLIYHREASSPYCIFGNANNSNQCYQFGVGDNWPGTDQQMAPGRYQLTIRAYFKSNRSYRQSGQWNLYFTLQ